MLDPTETALIGRWLSQGKTIVADPTCERIETLVTSHLVEVGRTEDGWSTLYRDPSDQRLWERTYPQDQLHGGGPPALHCLSLAEATARYEGIEQRSHVRE